MQHYIPKKSPPKLSSLNTKDNTFPPLIVFRRKRVPCDFQNTKTKAIRSIGYLSIVHKKKVWHICENMSFRGLTNTSAFLSQTKKY